MPNTTPATTSYCADSERLVSLCRAAIEFYRDGDLLLAGWYLGAAEELAFNSGDFPDPKVAARAYRLAQSAYEAIRLVTR